MSRRPYRPDALALRVFHGTDAVRAGELTPKQLRSSAWTRQRVNVYADSRLDDDHALAARCALLALPAGSILAGHSAAYAHGIWHAATATDAVHIYGPDGRRLGHRDGIRQHSGTLGQADVTKVGEALCTSPVRTAWDVGRWLPPLGSVPIIDSMLGQDLVSPDQLMRYARERFGQGGSRRSMTAFELTDGRAESRPESQLRVRLVVSGLPRPVVQLPIVLPNGLTLHPDLAWEEYLVAVEYDGIWHASAAQLHRDRRRLNLLVANGWIVLHVTSARMRTDFNGVVREIRAALESRGWRPRSR
jgi:hypothetical protein